MPMPEETTQKLMNQIAKLMRFQIMAISEPFADQRADAERRMFECHKELLRDIYDLAKRAG